jgi:Helix-turn-helix domain
MVSFRNGLALAAREHLAGGKPLTRLEALALYGVANLPDVIKEMRRQGWVIKSRNVSYAVAMARLNQMLKFEAPKNLPIKEIQFTEYWVSK